MVVRDIRQLIDKDFEPSTIDIENVILGDIRPPTIKDVAKPVDRSQITAVDKPKEVE